MRIAQIAPLQECVPPKVYGGTERIVSYLTEELVHQGHDLTLFASGDSETAAELVPSCDLALRLNPSVTQIQFECRLERLIPLGASTLFVGHVLLMHIAAVLRDDANHIDHMRYRPLGRIGGRRYVKLTEIIDV